MTYTADVSMFPYFKNKNGEFIDEDELESLRKFKENALEENGASAVCQDMMERIEKAEEENKYLKYQNNSIQNRLDTIEKEVAMLPEKILQDNNIILDDINSNYRLEEDVENYFDIIARYNCHLLDFNNELVKNDIYAIDWDDFVYNHCGMDDGVNRDEFRDDCVADEEMDDWNNSVANNNFNSNWESEYVEWATNKNGCYYFENTVDGDVYYQSN
jgi:hypothetical protein